MSAARKPTDRQIETLQVWRVRAMTRMPYLASLIYSLRVLDAPGLGTFAVDDHLRLYVDFDAVANRGMTEDEGGQALLHEASHLLARHAAQAKLLGVPRDAGRLWNAACFPAGTRLPGDVPIETVATMVRDFDGELVVASTTGGVVEATPEHPFLVRRRRHRKGAYPIVLEPSAWLEAGELREGDYLLVPSLNDKRADTSIDLWPYVERTVDRLGRRHNTPGVRCPELTEDLAWMIGLYVAEGSSSPSVRFSLGSYETDLIDRLHRVANEIGWSAYDLRSKRSRGTSVVLGTRLFGRWLKDNCGASAGTKHVPDLILRHQNPAIRRAFLEGLVDGDGWRGERTPGVPVVRVETASKALMHDLILLLAQDAIGGSAYERPQQEGRMIGGLMLPPGTLYGVQWNPDGCRPVVRHLNGKDVESCSHRWKADEDGVWYPIKSVGRKAFSGPVYNMTTESHTYIAHSFLVHNCDMSINDDLRDGGCSMFADNGRFLLPATYGLADYQTPMFYFDELSKRRNAQQQPGSNPGAQQPGGEQTDGSGGAGEGAGDPQDQASGDGGPFDGCGSGAGGSAAPCEIGADVDLDGYAPAASVAERERIDISVAAAVADHIAKGRGTVPAGMTAFAEQVMTPSVTPWQQVLASHVRRAVATKAGPYDADPSRRHRRRHRQQITDGHGTIRGRVVVPGTYSPELSAEAIRDTSGSMSPHDLGIVTREVEAIANRVGIRGAALRVTDVDAAVEHTTTYRGRGSLREVHGRGGTSMTVGIDAACARRPKPAVIVVLTDGETDWPQVKPSVPVVVALVAAKNRMDALRARVPTWAKVVCIPAT